MIVRIVIAFLLSCSIAMAGQGMGPGPGVGKPGGGGGGGGTPPTYVNSVSVYGASLASYTPSASGNVLVL